MPGRSSRLAALAVLSVALAAPAFAADKVTIDDLVVATTMPESRREATVTAASAFYAFWNTGDEKGQPIAFTATDLLKVRNGRITDNWHIEDNLTLLRQMGVAKVAP